MIFSVFLMFSLLTLFVFFSFFVVAVVVDEPMRIVTNETHVKSICHVVYFIASRPLGISAFRFTRQIFACVCQIHAGHEYLSVCVLYVCVCLATYVQFILVVRFAVDFPARPMAIIFAVSVYSMCALFTVQCTICALYILCKIENSKRCVIGNIEMKKKKKLKNISQTENKMRRVGKNEKSGEIGRD